MVSPLFFNTKYWYLILKSGVYNKVSKDRTDHVELTGTVIESNTGIFKVKLDSGNVITARPSGKIRQNKINVVVGDRVKVALSPYDLNNGMIKIRL